MNLNLIIISFLTSVLSLGNYFLLAPVPYYRIYSTRHLLIIRHRKGFISVLLVLLFTVFGRSTISGLSVTQILLSIILCLLSVLWLTIRCTDGSSNLTGLQMFLIYGEYGQLEQHNSFS